MKVYLENSPVNSENNSIVDCSSQQHLEYSQRDHEANWRCHNRHLEIDTQFKADVIETNKQNNLSPTGNYVFPF